MDYQDTGFIWDYLGRAPVCPEWLGLARDLSGAQKVWWGQKYPHQPARWSGSEGEPPSCPWLEDPDQYSDSPKENERGIDELITAEKAPCRFALVFQGGKPDAKLREALSRLLADYIDGTVAVRGSFGILDLMFSRTPGTWEDLTFPDAKSGEWPRMLEVFLLLRGEYSARIWLNLPQARITLVQTTTWSESDDFVRFPLFHGNNQTGGIDIHQPLMKGPIGWDGEYGKVLLERFGRLLGNYWVRRDEVTKDFLTRTIENLPVAITVIDTREGDKVIQWNQACTHLTGFPREMAMGKSLAELSQDGGFPHLKDLMEESLAQDSAGDRETRFEISLPDGRQKSLDLRMVALPGTDHLPRYLLISAIDVTERLEVEDQLRQAKTRAEEASLAKTTFLANMSHEIRTPIAAILGYGDMLLDPELTADQRGKANLALRNSGNHVMRLISNILEMSKIESGSLELDLTRFSPWDIAMQVIGELQSQAFDKGLRLELKALGPIPGTVVSDATRLKQILSNLVGNAIKFTEQGLVELRVQVREGHLCLEVADTGIGMTEEEAGRVFEPFQQAKGGVGNRKGGIGLGLTISRRLAGLLGGDLTLESRVGRGTTFMLTFDLAPLKPGPLSEPADVAGTHLREGQPGVTGVTQYSPELRVLIVDDHEDNLNILAYMLKKRGLSPAMARGGLQALAMMSAKEYDMVLLDIQMPDLDGHEVARRARSRGYQGPIVAVTANVMEGERENCIAAGCDSFLTKPVQQHRLEAILQDYLVQQDQSGNPVDKMEITDDFNPEMDDPELADLVREYLRGMPAQVQAIREHAEKGNLPDCRKLAHQLKGSGGMYGFPGFTALGARIEQGCQNGTAGKELAELIEDLGAMVERARAKFLS